MFDRQSLLNLESAQEHASPGVKKSVACKEMSIHCIVDSTISFCNQQPEVNTEVLDSRLLPNSVTAMDSTGLRGAFFNLGGYRSQHRGAG